MTFNDSANSLNQADRIGYISDDGIVLEKFGIGKLCPNYGRDIEFKEYLATETTKEKVYEVARDTFVDKTMINEADRIFERGKGTLNYGHPVHYMISTAKLQNLFHMLKATGTLFMKKEVLQDRLGAISFPIKSDNIIGLQLADFIPNVLARKALGKEQKNFSIYNGIENKLYDGKIDRKDKFGFKIIS